MPGTITRHKVPTTDTYYNPPSYEVRRDGVPIARVVRNGRPGVDHYPWDWMLNDGVPAAARERAGRVESRRMGCADTLTAAIEEVTEWAGTVCPACGALLTEEPHGSRCDWTGHHA